MAEQLKNWAGNLTYHAAKFHKPGSVEELQEIVGRSHKVKALGTRHSFTDIADTEGDLVSMEALNKVVELDWQNATVTVEGGIRYGELCSYLDKEGYALHNLASLPHISVAGACATATHGSGDQNGNLATAVVGLDIVTANGEIVSFTSGESAFDGAVVNLGGLGIVARTKLRIMPSFTLEQRVFEDLPFAQLEKNFDDVMASGYSVSLFTDWEGPKISQVWVKGFVPAGSSLFGATAASEKLHPIKRKSPVNCTEQMGIPGPWHERLAHFRLEYTPSSGEELQSEYLIPRKHAVEAIQAVRSLKDRIRTFLQISEIRTVAADDLWMSPCYLTDCVAIHFTWKRDLEGVRNLLPVLELALDPYEARPHWAKLFASCPNYVRMPDFRALLVEHDPGEKFRNRFLNALVASG